MLKVLVAGPHDTNEVHLKEHIKQVIITAARVPSAIFVVYPV
jgi:hypothetical protein